MKTNLAFPSPYLRRRWRRFRKANQIPKGTLHKLQPLRTGFDLVVIVVRKSFHRCEIVEMEI